MSSEEEMESFEFSEEDLFKPRKRRFTKQDAMLGIWADRDSDDEGVTASSKEKDYSRPVNFVSSAKRNDNDDSDSDNEDIDAQVEYILDNIEQKTLEKNTAEKIGIGNFQVASLEKNRNLHAFETKSTKPLQGSKERVTKSKTIAEKRQKELMKSDKEWGRWEKHSSGFGSRIMKKMGYVPGKGLGKKGEGIVNPVKAVKTVELGHGSHESSWRTSGGIAEDSEEEKEEEQFQKQLQQWQKIDNNYSRPKYVFKTVEDLKESSKKKPYNKVKDQLTKLNKVKVIDMTGKETRVLNSYSDLKGHHAKYTANIAENVFVPELLHNLEILIKDTESEIINTDNSLHYHQDLVVNLTYERNRLEQVIEQENYEITKISEIMDVIAKFENSIASNQLSLSYCKDTLSNLQHEYPHEYKTYQLNSVAVAVVFPKLQDLLENWDLFADPYGPVEVFQQWRSILRESQYTSCTPPEPEEMDIYDRLIWEIWMPKFRLALTSWSPKTQINNVIDILKYWMPLLPEWILNNILESIILPKLQEEVEIWNPTTDPIPIHSWIHPWLPLMDDLLEILYPPIRMKLGAALNNWMPSDSSALVIIRPWIKVFSPEVMEAFLSRTVLPKLEYCLQTLVINPQDQITAPIEWILQWKEVIPLHHFVNMFEKYFFPKWLQVLNNWLSGNPDYDEIMKWYSGWKSLFDSNLLADQTVKSNFNLALSLMDHAARGILVPGMKESMAYFTTSERRKAVEYQASQKITGILSNQTSVGFKDIIEKKAEELGIVFIPTSKRHEGKTLHLFGANTIYIDRGVIFTMISNRWTPISLDELVDRTLSSEF